MSEGAGALGEAIAATSMDPVQIGVVGAAVFLILLLIVILIRGIAKSKKRKAARQQESSSSKNLAYETGKIIAVVPQSAPAQDAPHRFEGYANDEVTNNPYGDDGNEKTNNPYGDDGDEKTNNPYGDPGYGADQPYGNPGYGADQSYGEVTDCPYPPRYDDEETVNPYSASGEETIAPNWAPQTVVRFSVNAEGVKFDKEIAFTDRMEIGRDPLCQLHLEPQYVSRHHLELSALPDGLYIRNLCAEKSERFTRLNRVEMGDSFMPVNNGDYLEIAHIKITIEIINN